MTEQRRSDSKEVVDIEDIEAIDDDSAGKRTTSKERKGRSGVKNTIREKPSNKSKGDGDDEGRNSPTAKQRLKPSNKQKGGKAALGDAIAGRRTKPSRKGQDATMMF